MGVPSIGYLEGCRETKNRNILGRKMGYNEGVWHQGANNWRLGTFGIAYKTLIFSFLRMYKMYKKRIIIVCCRWMNSIMIN